MKGWIVLDIDGTLTQEKDSIPHEVIEFLHKAVNNGWNIAFATGRAFAFAQPLFKRIHFPFMILPQNGSIALRMPSQEIVFKKYMKPSILVDLENIYEGKKIHFLIYSGFENGDRCYFYPKRFSQQDLIYLNEVKKRENEQWIDAEKCLIDFDIPLIKCFGKIDTMKKIGGELLKKGLFEISLIRDPFHDSYYILLITDVQASKGNSLREMFLQEGRGDLVIAAGDDENDIGMLQAADIKIVMPHAPEGVRKLADFIAPPVSEMGIIHALKVAIQR